MSNLVDLRWIEEPISNRDQIERYGHELGLHPLVIEDCLHSNQRAKFDDFDGHQLLVWFLFYEKRIIELEFVVLPRVVFLVSSEPCPNGKSWFETLGLTLDQRDSFHLLYHALDRALDLSSAETKLLFEEVESFEARIFEETLDPREMVKKKNQLAKVENAHSALQTVAAQMYRFLNPKDDLRWRLRDLLDHCQRIHQKLQFNQNQINSALETYWGVSAKRTNDRIKKLSLIASISLPLSFWCSFWGMNFQTIPFGDPRFFVWAMFLMFFSSGGIYFFLKRKGYWED